MTQVMHNTNGNLYPSNGPFTADASNSLYSNSNPYMYSPPLAIIRPVESSYGVPSKDPISGFSYQKDSLIQREAARNDDDLQRTTFSPSLCCTCLLLIIGLFFCPLLAIIGLALADRAISLQRKTSSEVQTRGVLVNAPRHPGLTDAEKYNHAACHLGVAAIVAGAIILSSIVAVVLFLFLSTASVLVSGTVWSNKSS